jgi:DNA-binding transcriptional ArsR family regulator
MAKATTLYLRPPEPKTLRRDRPKTARQEIHQFLFRYRYQLLPLMVMFALGCLTRAFPSGGWRVPYLAIGLALITIRYGDRYPQRFRLLRRAERWYAGTCLVAGAWWYRASTPEHWHVRHGARYLEHAAPGWYAYLVLFVAGCLVASPWWYHYRTRGSIPVTFLELSNAERAEHLQEARTLISDWVAFASAAHLQGSKIRGIIFDPWSVRISLQMRAGATVSEVTTRRREKIESAADAYIKGGVQHRAARMEKGERAGLSTLRIMLRDPHSEPIPPPPMEELDAESLMIGMFETGLRVMFCLVNTLLGGETGGGKSGVLNAIIWALSRCRKVAVLGIDMSPGATELKPWEPVMAAPVASTPAEVGTLLNHLQAALLNRGELMRQRGWRSWRASESDPFIVLVIDEVQRVKDAKLGRYVDDVVTIIRKFGGCVILTTQYPKRTPGPITPVMAENCIQRIGVRTETQYADQVIFGSRATADGWQPSLIRPDRPGSFMIKSPIYWEPLQARAVWVAEEAAPQLALEAAPLRTMIDSATWEINARVPESLPGVADDAEIVDAEIVPDDDPKAAILAALADGITKAAGAGETLTGRTGQSKATVYRHLRDLVDQGLVAPEGRRGHFTLAPGYVSPP